MGKSTAGVDILYRAIKRSRPELVIQNGINLRVSPALFKDENGVSVDRKMQRDEEMVLLQMKNNFDKRLKGIVQLSESDVTHVNAIVVPKPTNNNKYHAEIHKNCSEVMLDDLQALQLADKCCFVFFDYEKTWTDSSN